jgi:hypothetical protein
VSEGNGGVKNLAFTVTLSDASGKTVTVQYTTADGTATAGSDYVAKSGTLTFLPGAISHTITVTVNGDALVEENEAIQFLLATAINAVIDDGQGQGLILNDDEDGSGSAQNMAALFPAANPRLWQPRASLPDPALVMYFEELGSQMTDSSRNLKRRPPAGAFRLMYI